MRTQTDVDVEKGAIEMALSLPPGVMDWATQALVVAHSSSTDMFASVIAQGGAVMPDGVAVGPIDQRHIPGDVSTREGQGVVLLFAHDSARVVFVDLAGAR